MPMKSQQQRKLMWAVTSNPSMEKKVGVPLSVAKEFTKMDQGGKLPRKKRKKKGA